ncbi:MAG: prephenate dehydrogenase [bacterium]|nr:prephenate dehydrogenase [bacterium]
MTATPTGRPLFQRIYLLGTGLIGGSLVLDLKDKGLVGSVVGSDRDGTRQDEAVELGILDETAPPVPETFRQCDLVILAVPVLELLQILEKGFEGNTLVTDVGSVKKMPVSAYRRAVEAGRGYRFVPGHPIAGDERSGPAAARKGLFEGARVILTPVEGFAGVSTSGRSLPGGTLPADVELIQLMWEGTGAETLIMDPDIHDSVFAWVSHMPHMAAYAIIDAVLGNDPELVDLSGGGLRDYTRIAASSPRMWADIAVANREHILTATRGFRNSVDKILKALEDGDRERLEEIFKPIAALRRGQA